MRQSHYYNHCVSFISKGDASNAKDLIAQQEGFEPGEIEEHDDFFRVPFSSDERINREDQHRVLRATRPDKGFALNRDEQGRWISPCGDRVQLPTKLFDNGLVAQMFSK